MDVLKDSEGDANVSNEDLPVIFQCQSCKSILSDSLAFLASNDDLKTITVNRVNSSVKLSTKLITSTEGVDQGSTYSPVVCHDCHSVVGKVYRTTPRLLDDLRDFYTLDANKLSIYQVGCGGTTVSPADDATSYLPNVTDLKTLKETILKLQVLMCTMHERIANIEKSLDTEDIDPSEATQDLNQKPLSSNPKQKPSNSNKETGRVSKNASTCLGSNFNPAKGDSSGPEDLVSNKETPKRYNAKSAISPTSFEERNKEIEGKERSRKRLKKSGNI